MKNLEKELQKKWLEPHLLGKKIRSLREKNKTIATLNGSFDLMHSGHLRIIYEASIQADILIVALNTDSSIQRYKSKKRPIIELKYLVTRENSEDMDKFKTFASELGADRVVFKTLQVSLIEKLENGSSLLNEKFLPGNMQLTRYRKNKNGMIETDINWFMRNRCFRVYYSFQIDWQGNVLPCCFDKDSDYIMGNVYRGTIS
ncbi:hypothetical protein LCGC14_1778470, partial [marine sediment metagenome]